MSIFDGFRDRLRWLFRSGETEAQLDHELRLHMEMEAARLIEAGVPPHEATRRARLTLGNLTETREAVRAERGIGWIDDLARDLGYAFRGLRRRPGFTFAVLATIAVGIGATTAVYSVADGVALKPLPHHDPGRLVAVWPDRFLSQAEHLILRRETRSLTSVAGYAPWTMALTAVEDPTQVRAARTSSNLFETLGARAALGRTFRPDEDQPGAAPVAVLSHAMWTGRFGADSLVLGRQLTLDGAPYTIIGVMPRTFAVLAGHIDLWVPLPADAAAWYYRSGISLTIGRLADGVTPAAAAADLSRVLPLVRAELGLPETYGEGAAILGLREYVTGQYRGLSLVLLGAVAGILLLAAANLVNLLLGRADSRRPEMVMRLALGAKPARLVRQLLTEGAALAVIGSALGLTLAALLLGVFRQIAPADTPRLAEVGLGSSVLAVAAGLTVVMAVVLGLAQAAGSLVRSRTPGTAGDRRVTARTGGVLIVAETAVAVTLIVGAGLMIRTLGQLADVDPGFGHRNVLTLRVQPVSRDPARVDAFYRSLFERIGALPGVTAVGAIQHLPLSGISWGVNLEIEGQPLTSGQERPRVGFRLISGAYLGALGIPIRAGRAFDARDVREGLPVALVSETMAARFWPGTNAVGQRLRLGTDTSLVTIIGVVGDVRHGSLAANPEPELYRPAAQAAMPALMLAIRTTVAPTSLARAAQAAVWEIDPTVPVAEVMPFEVLLANSVGDRRLLALVLAVFAAVALLVGAIGVFGVTSFAVTRQTREIGIRMALGATRDSVRAAVFRRGMALVLGGIGIGLGAALALTRFLGEFLYDVGATDPATFAVVAALLGVVAAAAIAGPALRATRVDPVTVLRAE